MRKRRVDLKIEDRRSYNIYDDNIIKISKEGKEYFFEIGKELTSDISEAVTILMRMTEFDNPIWELSIGDVRFDELTPEKSLFWLTGGHNEWKNKENYNKPWCECYLDFQEEFGSQIVDIVSKSKSLGDIRDGFIRELNIVTLYEFALIKGIIK